MCVKHTSVLRLARRREVRTRAESSRRRLVPGSNDTRARFRVVLVSENGDRDRAHASNLARRWSGTPLSTPTHARRCSRRAAASFPPRARRSPRTPRKRRRGPTPARHSETGRGLHEDVRGSSPGGGGAPALRLLDHHEEIRHAAFLAASPSAPDNRISSKGSVGDGEDVSSAVRSTSARRTRPRRVFDRGPRPFRVRHHHARRGREFRGGVEGASMRAHAPRTSRGGDTATTTISTRAARAVAATTTAPTLLSPSCSSRRRRSTVGATSARIAVVRRWKRGWALASTPGRARRSAEIMPRSVSLPARPTRRARGETSSSSTRGVHAARGPIFSSRAAAVAGTAAGRRHVDTIHDQDGAAGRRP